jgi:CheY-like chemotaxis protein
MGSTDHMCVLVVDDEPDIRETLREAVEMAGCTAILAANGEDALKLMTSRRPCMVIVDLMMPVMTGLELLQAMQQVPALADLPVVISTSAPRRAPPGLPILPKPIDLSALWRWMRQNCSCSSESLPT